MLTKMNPSEPKWTQKMTGEPKWTKVNLNEPRWIHVNLSTCKTNLIQVNKSEPKCSPSATMSKIVLNFHELLWNVNNYHDLSKIIMNRLE